MAFRDYQVTVGVVCSILCAVHPAVRRSCGALESCPALPTIFEVVGRWGGLRIFPIPHVKAAGFAVGGDGSRVGSGSDIRNGRSRAVRYTQGVVLEAGISSSIAWVKSSLAFESLVGTTDTEEVVSGDCSSRDGDGGG